eukprot:m.126504 g.126504  ORF g.126504 m.126504 type:complete len:1106 (+) comp37900_c0_seq10:317-3634(+)
MSASDDDEYLSDFSSPSGEESFVNDELSESKERVDDSIPFLDLQETGEIEWKNSLSLKALKLTLSDILQKCQLKDGSEGAVDLKALKHEKIKLEKLLSLHMARRQWLLTGSRKLFGQLEGKSVAVIFDMTTAVNEFNQLPSYLHNLQDLVLDQLSRKKVYYLAAVSSQSTPLWEDPTAVTSASLRNASHWIQGLRPCAKYANVLLALQQVFCLQQKWDSICLILTSKPSQSVPILQDFVCESMAGLSCAFHTVAYSTHDPDTIEFLQNLADVTSGSYHRFLETFVESPAVVDINQKICKAQGVLHTVDRILSDGRPMALCLLVKKLLKDGEWNYKALPLSELLVYPLQFREPFLGSRRKAFTSQQWLHQNGLKAKGLSLYQVLAPNAVPQMDAYVPIIDKTVRAHVHDDYMAKLVWHDGSIKHIHVDPKGLKTYQWELEKIAKTFKKRNAWLLSGSRGVFGSLAEKRIGVLVDTSFSSLESLTRFQEHFRLFLEEQLVTVNCFVIVKFAREAEMWREGLIRTNEDSLNDLWRWVLSWDYGGSCDLLNALRIVLESESEFNPFDLDALYVFLSGHPNQKTDQVVSYLDERLAGDFLPLHVAFYDERRNAEEARAPSKESPTYYNDSDAIDLMGRLTAASGGRFHHFTEAGLVKGDDLTAILNEIENAKKFHEKASQLLERCEQIKRNRLALRSHSPTLETPVRKSSPFPKEPKETASSLARKAFISEVYSEKQQHSSVTRPKSAPLARSLSHHHYYTGYGNDKDMSINKLELRKPKTVELKSLSIPVKEELLSSKQWLQKYGLSKLGLDLDRLVSSMDSGHRTQRLALLNQDIAAQHCCGLPRVTIKGVVRHMKLRPFELQSYESQLHKVLKRYEKRWAWLTSGSRAIFGPVIEKRAVFVVDVSGSMASNLEQLKIALAALIWEQVHGYQIQFDVISFSGDSLAWRGKVVEAEEENCRDAIQFISGFKAEGNTNTLKALELALQIYDVDGVYLITKGRPDQSTEKVLEVITKCNEGKRIPINTVSFDCHDKVANEFLKNLSAQNRGRFHQCATQDDESTQTPQSSQHSYNGNDLQRLARELRKAKRFLTDSQSYRELLIPSSAKSS